MEKVISHVIGLFLVSLVSILALKRWPHRVSFIGTLLAAYALIPLVVDGSRYWLFYVQLALGIALLVWRWLHPKMPKS